MVLIDDTSISLLITLVQKYDVMMTIYNFRFFGFFFKIPLLRKMFHKIRGLSRTIVKG